LNAMENVNQKIGHVAQLQKQIVHLIITNVKAIAVVILIQNAVKLENLVFQ